MQIGYARVSKSGDAQNLDLQYDALTKAGVDKQFIYEDRASGKKDSRPGLDGLSQGIARGRHARRVEAGSPRARPAPSGECRAGPHGAWSRPARAGGPGRADRHGNPGRPPRLRHLRCPGGVRARTDPRAHHRRTRGCPCQGKEGADGSSPSPRPRFVSLRPPCKAAIPRWPNSPRNSTSSRSPSTATLGRKESCEQTGSASSTLRAGACGSPAVIVDWLPAWGVGFRRWFWG